VQIKYIKTCLFLSLITIFNYFYGARQVKRDLKKIYKKLKLYVLCFVTYRNPVSVTSGGELSFPAPEK